MRTIWIVAILCLVASFVAGCSNDAASDPSAPGEVRPAPSVADKCGGSPAVFPPDAHPGGNSYAAWSTLAWQWLASCPLDHNPALDETGEDMDYLQSGSVWYLVANFTGGQTIRTGIVPTGTMLYLSLIGFEASTLEGLGETEAELRAAAAGAIDIVTNLSCEIDGEPVPDLEDYRFTSPELFCLTVPEDNVFDLWIPDTDTPAGTYYPSVADGYYLMVPPLSAGEHTIHWHAEIPDFGYTPDITYNITVVGGHHHHRHHHHR